MSKIEPVFLSVLPGSSKLINQFPLSNYSCVNNSVIRRNFSIVSTVLEALGRVYNLREFQLKTPSKTGENPL